MSLNACLSGLLACSLFLTGGIFGGVSQKDYDALKAENDTLKAELEAVRTEYAEFVAKTPIAIAELIFSGADPTAKSYQEQSVEAGIAARIETDCGVYSVTAIEAVYLPADSWKESRYLVRWEVVNESFSSSAYNGVLIYPEDFQVYDANDYLCSYIYTDESLNSGQTVLPGRRCVYQACYRACGEKTDCIEFVFPARNVTFKISVASEENQ